MGLFGPEKMTLILEKYDYKPGDIIKGTATLKLKKPTAARKLEVTFIGEKQERRTHTDRDAHGHMRTHTTTVYVPIYDFKMQLDGEKEYFEGTFPFEIKIPAELSNIITAQTHNILPFSLGRVSNPIRWHVKVQLDVPMRLDIKESKDIVISQ